MREYIIDGVPLRDPEGQWFIDYTRSDLVGVLSRTIVSESLYGFHGTKDSAEGFFGSGREVIVLNVTGPTEEIFQQNLRGLLGLWQRPSVTMLSAPHFTPLGSGVGRVGRSFPGVLQWTARGRLAISPAIERVGSRAARVTFTIDLPEAFWKSSLLHTTGAVTLTTSLLLDLSPLADDSTAPITDAAIRIKGPISAGGFVRLHDGENSWRSLQYTSATALTSTQYVIIDLNTLKAFRVSIPSWDQNATGSTDVSHALNLSGEGAFSFSPQQISENFPITSLIYNTRIRCGSLGTGSVVEIRGRRSYLS